jgi:CubicO group peptidase (beta-lactamase class C family)
MTNSGSLRGLLLAAVGLSLMGQRAAAISGETHRDPPQGKVAKPGQAPHDASPLLEPILTRHKIPGMAAAVVRGNRTVALGAAGIRRRGSPEKVSLHDRFHIGSCTKAMTATLCAMLVEEGKLSWKTTLAHAFPKLAGKMNPEFRSVTLEQLLTHRGGMPEDLNRDGLWQNLWQYRGAPAGARQLLLEGVVAEPPVAKPGTKFLYSNAGFAIAGHIAERTAGKPWEELMRERLFRPLGMASAGFGAPGGKEVVDEPRGHTASGKPIDPGPSADNPVAIGPAGIVHCSLADWAKFVALHLRGDQGDARLLGPATFKKLHAPAAGEAEGYAMGWSVTKRDWGGGGVLTHSGSNTFWFAVTWVAPKRDFAVLVACNQGGKEAEKACDEASWQLIREFLLQRKPGNVAGLSGHEMDDLVEFVLSL